MHFMSTKTIPSNVKCLKREQNLTCSSVSVEKNMEHLQCLHISLISTVASKNNLCTAFAEHFMSSTYVTTHPT